MSALFGKTKLEQYSPDSDTRFNEVPIYQQDDDTKHNKEIGQLSLDVLENKESLYILAPLAGIKLEDIDISIDGNALVIRGERNKPKEFFNYGIEIKNEECFWGRFQRKILLPDNIDFSAIKAIMEHNLLVISLPKIRFSGKNIRIETHNL